ncbi:D-glycerate dehydrogenase [Planosporangium flavigriseum]|uniref:D-glycerate dehydrogenase n=1 Tax=Planosporangium flavigriseum TaxID=373681 RepID=A0A8J3LLW7_9ACTN|nr:D-glycerate dehydrogenase [Planosporangium flavigriseum]NJC62986.1 D-glycerate dehydrogenase [Planosporangium flavigriseum]GIG73145.1 D-glycerate dehydrogenase [Planosporangium flavigriseum]
MRVVVTQPIHREASEKLRSAGLDVVESAQARPVGGQELADLCAGAAAVITHLTDRVDATVFTANPQLRVVANVATGYDNIDVAAASGAGVAVTNTPDVLTDATADLTLALMLAVARRIPEGDAMLRRGEYTGWQLMQHPMGLDVSGRTIGIVGMGRIGRAVARRAHLGFGMPVRYVGRSPGHPADDAEIGARRVGLPELLAQSDFVSLHCPLTPETRHLISAAALRAMKPTAVLVNTARGPLVDERALARALRAGEIAGAGLDVFEREPEVESELLDLRERVVLMPHVGSATESTRRRMSEVAVANVLSVLAGDPPINPVS